MFHTIKTGSLEYLTADSLSGSVHCFSTRFGGVSEGHLASLNLGTHRGDAPENVRENYRILGAAAGFAPEQTVFTKQEHTDTILRVGRADCGTGLSREQTVVCDGLITDEPGVALCCFGADCTTILLFDPVTGALGAVHSGWRGTAMGIAAKAVAAMCREFGCDPAGSREEQKRGTHHRKISHCECVQRCRLLSGLFALQGSHIIASLLPLPSVKSDQQRVFSFSENRWSLISSKDV